MLSDLLALAHQTNKMSLITARIEVVIMRNLIISNNIWSKTLPIQPWDKLLIIFYYNQ